jgi:hypothetical protein
MYGFVCIFLLSVCSACRDLDIPFSSLVFSSSNHHKICSSYGAAIVPGLGGRASDVSGAWFLLVAPEMQQIYDLKMCVYEHRARRRLNVS